MPAFAPDERARLRDHLLATGISGDTRTTRGSVVGNAERLAEADPDKLLGLGDPKASLEEILAAVAAVCGCSPAATEREGPGVIDPDRTLDELDRLAARLVQAAERRERVLIATGHPAGLLPMYAQIGRALQARGVTLETPRDNEIQGTSPNGRGGNRVRYLDGVAAACDGANLLHTHEWWLMEGLLEAADPALVLADHGFAGAAIAAGIETCSLTDVNDPALCLAWARDPGRVVVPLDDNRPPANYRPLADAIAALILA